MTRQLTLIDTHRPWRLDEHTRQVGRRGLAQARAALRESRGHGSAAAHAHPPGDRAPTPHKPYGAAA